MIYVPWLIAYAALLGLAIWLTLRWLDRRRA